MTEPIKLEMFVSLWAIILYVLSIFYGLLMLYSGFNFMSHLAFFLGLSILAEK
jgi:hypothetical protein